MKKRTTKEILVQTMLTLVEHKPVDKITVKQIVEESGVSMKTFYNHFQDKNDLIFYIIISEVESTQSKIQNGNYTFRDSLIDTVHFFRKFQHFLINANNNIPYPYSFEKKHREACNESMTLFIMKSNQISSFSEEMRFAVRMYTFGLVEMFSFYFLYENEIETETFVRFCENAMPEMLKPFLL